MNIVDRFISYTKINTTTNRENGAAGIMPSSPGQRELAEQLKQELEALGTEDIVLNDRAILTATLPSNIDTDLPTVAFSPIWTPVRSRQRIPKPILLSTRVEMLC